MYIVVVLAIIPIFTKKKPVAKFVNRNTLKEVTIHLKIKKKVGCMENTYNFISFVYERSVLY